MSILPEFIENLSLAVQPLVFESGINDFPYTTLGTVFLVGHNGKIYVITTRHGLSAENLPAICVFPTDTSQKIFPLGRMLSVPRTDEPEDFMDFAIIDVDANAKMDPELGQARLIDFEKAYKPGWDADADQMAFYVFGYPSERSEINFETQELRTDRIVLSGKYGGQSSLPYLHRLQITDSQCFESYSGFSGGPVFGIHTNSFGNVKPILCGMAVRGTPSSATIYFLDSSVLRDALEFKSQQDASFIGSEL